MWIQGNTSQWLVRSATPQTASASSRATLLAGWNPCRKTRAAAYLTNTTVERCFKRVQQQVQQGERTMLHWTTRHEECAHAPTRRTPLATPQAEKGVASIDGTQLPVACKTYCTYFKYTTNSCKSMLNKPRASTAKTQTQVESTLYLLCMGRTMYPNYYTNAHYSNTAILTSRIALVQA